MTIAELWREAKSLPYTLGFPLRDPHWFRQHTAAHLVGGPAWWLFGLFVLRWLVQGVVGVLSYAGYPLTVSSLWFPGLAWVGAVGATVIRQGWMRETKGPREFPLYAMVWDSVTSSLAAAVAAILWVLIHG